ncbi:auxin-responsive protein SAUR50-like [Diospyros lotus]|uniref:auxin-responsive protein SAUR50-like n=1 Tax=Diospyros lotus TaxID=55363 RepID=UPI00225BBE88|nr:auxin-responsive protein SAUR50-like [Diospyros lotus]
MDSSSSKSMKIRDIVRLQQLLKKWKKLATNAPKNSTKRITSTAAAAAANNGKTMKFLKRTLSFSDDVVPKGFLAVCVGKELKRFIIPMEYLGHRAFGILLREAEEEFGFQQEGVLKIPCEVAVFKKILKMVEEKRDVFSLHENGLGGGGGEIMETGVNGACFSPDCDLIASPSTSHHPQLCR